MSNTSSIPKWFKIVAIILLVWNVLGLLSFFDHIGTTEEALAKLSLAEQELYGRYPLWTKIVFGMAVVTGFLGALFLVLKRKAAYLLFGISLISILIQMGHSIFIAKAPEVYGAMSYVMPLMVILIAIYCLMLSNRANKSGWTR